MNLQALIEANRGGKPTGLPSFCTANEHVLKAILSVTAQTRFPTVIEATCNQVNQDGGYTGMTPANFIDWLHALADNAGADRDDLLIGGDHLGPNPWLRQSPESAMAKARDLVRGYVASGFRKIHLDASMALGGEAHPSFELVAERAADLCAVAEDAAADPSELIYVIGTEVPVPGGETTEPDALDVTSVARLEKTIETHRAAFEARGLHSAWKRIASVVTQPGVDFGHSALYRFDPLASKNLSAAILDFPGLTFEAHSTDYQPDEALAQLVEQHFFFLKVGPELTFRFREAIFALAGIEELIDPPSPSRIREIIEERMAAQPGHWQDYYKGSQVEMKRLRQFSYSDRIRYYWGDSAVAAALSHLFNNLLKAGLTETLVSQYFNGFPFGHIPTDATEILHHHVQTSVRRYFAACGYTN
ncbi:class II D-tagatose-bisphosphate aldolase non-catalytic subunit [Martelella sp. FOR1707]